MPLPKKYQEWMDYLNDSPVNEDGPDGWQIILLEALTDLDKSLELLNDAARYFTTSSEIYNFLDEMNKEYNEKTSH